MYYAQMLRARNAMLWTFGAGIATCLVLAAAVALFPEMHARPGSDATALAIVLWAAALLAAIIGSILGSSLAVENCHLEFVRTKPISPARHALGVLALDSAYLLLIFAGACVLGYWAASMILGAPLHVTGDSVSAMTLLRFAFFPLAWFALSQALTAGIQAMKLGGMVIGLSWPIAEGLSILAVLPLAAPWHSIMSFLNLANPIGYFPFWEIFDESRGSVLRSHFGYGLTIDALALVAIAIVGVAVATARWRRVEA